MIPTYTIKKKKCAREGCEHEFAQFNSLQKYCSPHCEFLVKQSKGPAKQVKRSPINRMSNKRAIQERQYNKRVKIWKVGKMCAVYPYLPCVDNHHRKGREGDMLLNEKYWLPVSREGHNFINQFPDIARERGWIINRGQKE